MVKADPKRDYYADLDLPPNADEDQIKKQFRLLAKQYHPDRNPGHEVEFVSKFQAVQAAHEILSDPSEKARYDAARAKNQHRASEPKFPPPPKDDPYNFRKPTRAQTTNFAPPPPQPKPKSRPAPYTEQAYAFPRQGPAPSPGAEKLSQFARGAQTQRWDRQKWEDASRAEGMRGFQRMPAGGPPPQMPPRPPRQHPTATRPPQVPVSPDTPNGNPGFPGLSRTNSARRMQFPDEKPAPRSAYAYVRGDRPPSSAAAHSYDTFTPQSPPMARAQAASESPLRHSRSTEQTRGPQRPHMYERQTSRYASNSGEKTDIRGGLGRSASVRNSPVDPQWDEDSGPFGTRPHSHHAGAQSQPPPPRHRSASPAMRQASYDTSSSGSEDHPIYVGNQSRRPKAEPKSRQFNKSDGLDTFFPSSNYTRVVDDRPTESGSYTYPAPPSKDGPIRHPFPNMTSPDEPKPDPRNSFSTSTTTAEHPSPHPAFQPAKFQHEDWAEKLRQDSTSPTKQQRGSRSREARRPAVSSSNSVDAMEVDPAPTDYSKRHSNGNINLDDLKAQVPLKSNGGLNGMADDLKSNLPFESRASAHPPLQKASTFPQSRLKITDLPRPPKLIHPPSDDCLDRQNWVEYIDGMKRYVADWAQFEEKMIDHFHTRNRLVRTMMADNWVASTSDGPPGNQINESEFATDNGDKKAGFGTYMEWLADDKVCHIAWETACDRHRGCMDELGKVREKIKSMGNHDA